MRCQHCIGGTLVRERNVGAPDTLACLACGREHGALPKPLPLCSGRAPRLRLPGVRAGEAEPERAQRAPGGAPDGGAVTPPYIRLKPLAPVKRCEGHDPQR